MTVHTCHAVGCNEPVDAKLFMCKPHWFTLPSNIREAVWHHYRPGQEKDKRPTLEYLGAARRATTWLEAFRQKKLREWQQHADQNPTLFGF